MEEHADEIKALREQMREARKAGDDEKLQELREQMDELRGQAAGEQPMVEANDED